jgi:hypothetical protein
MKKQIERKEKKSQVLEVVAGELQWDPFQQPQKRQTEFRLWQTLQNFQCLGRSG